VEKLSTLILNEKGEYIFFDIFYDMFDPNSDFITYKDQIKRLNKKLELKIQLLS